MKEALIVQQSASLKRVNSRKGEDFFFFFFFEREFGVAKEKEGERKALMRPRSPT